MDIGRQHFLQVGWHWRRWNVKFWRPWASARVIITIVGVQHFPHLSNGTPNDSNRTFRSLAPSVATEVNTYTDRPETDEYRRGRCNNLTLLLERRCRFRFLRHGCADCSSFDLFMFVCLAIYFRFSHSPSHHLGGIWNERRVKVKKRMNKVLYIT